MAVSRENKLPPSFLDFKSQRVLYESSHDGVSRIENDQNSHQTTQQVSLIFGCSKRFSDFKMAV